MLFDAAEQRRKQKEYELQRYLWRDHCRTNHGMNIPEIAGRGKQKSEETNAKNS